MGDFFNNISSNFILLAFAGGIAIVLASIVTDCFYKIRRDSTASELKKDMLDRGMSADEIKTVLEAGKE
jgi:hypothetical protein